MTYLTLLITVPLTLIAVFFAVANTTEAPFFLLPGAEAVTLPIYIVGLGMLLGGFLGGALFVGIHAQRTTYQLWQEKKRAAQLEKDLDALHKKHETLQEKTNAEKIALPKLAPEKLLTKY